MGDWPASRAGLTKLWMHERQAKRLMFASYATTPISATVGRQRIPVLPDDSNVIEIPNIPASEAGDTMKSTLKLQIRRIASIEGFPQEDRRAGHSRPVPACFVREFLAI